MSINRSKIISFLVLTFFFIRSNDVACQNTSNKISVLGGLKYGPFAVGFSVLSSVDSSRRMSNGQYRPVQIGVWYPAQLSKEKMAYRNYVALSANESDFHSTTDAERDDAIKAFKEFGISVGTPEKAMEQWISMGMYASFNAVQQAGKYPIVIVAQGNYQSSADQAFLCEYVASHGFVVATSPSPTRIVGPIRSNDDVLPTAMDQDADMNFILSKIISNFHGDQRNIAVIAHSFGARSALVFIQQHPEVKAFVSLDGGIGNAIGKEWIEKFSAFKPQSIHTPILHFYQNIDSAVVIPDFEILKSLKNSQCTLILVNNMHHYYFSSVGFVAGAISDFSKNFDPDLTFKCQSYAYYTLQFLERHMMNTEAVKLDPLTISKLNAMTIKQEME